MSPCGRLKIVGVFCLVFCLRAVAATPISGDFRANFKIVEDYKIIVRVSINGAGPFDFLLDTGTNRTVLDQKLAVQLGLPRVGDDTVSGILGNAKARVVRTQSISLAGVVAEGLDVYSADLPGRVRGLLGEDFLRNFDVLIDYGHKTIQIDPGTNQLANALDGERLTVSLHGSLQGNHSTDDRLIVSGRAKELGDKPVSLLLDTGANALVLFGGPGSLGEKATREQFTATSFLGGGDKFTARTRIVTLQLGNGPTAKLQAMAPPAVAGMDTDGVVPMSVFKSIFISHSGRFVILEPSYKVGHTRSGD
jgi:predicted aspartyl protease